MTEWLRRYWWPFLLVVFALKMGMRDVANWAFWDWIAYSGIVVAALIVAIDAAIGQSAKLKGKIVRPFEIPLIGYVPLLAILISAGAFAKQQLTPPDFFLPNNAETGSPFGIVQAWGINQTAFYMIVKPSSIQHVGSTQRLLLIIRPNYANYDRMTDTNILKSQPYTILDGFMTLALPLGQPLRIDLTQTTPIEFDLVEIPTIFSQEQITSLSDVMKLGGKILASTGTIADFRHATSAPPNVCPPTSGVRPNKT